MHRKVIAIVAAGVTAASFGITASMVDTGGVPRFAVDGRPMPAMTVML